MKRFKGIICLVLSAMLMFSAAACSDPGEDGGFNDDGSYKPSVSGSVVNFWGWGKDVEQDVFSKLTQDFNDTIGKDNNIKVEYNFIPSSSYVTQARMSLESTTPADILYVGDGDIKTWADAGLLERLDGADDNYLVKNGGMDLSAMWPSGVNRYRYNPATTTANSTDPLWGLPKDIGPTVIYYNATYMANAGITVVSVSAEEMKQKFGQTIPDTSKTYSWKGYDSVQKVFNNRIAMNWEETVELANILKNGTTPANTNCEYGFFTEWWFNYGWSVGGDCMEAVDEGGKLVYKFTLGDETPNYMVNRKAEQNFTMSANEHVYAPGQIISYTDKVLLTGPEKDGLDELPSQRAAFTEFCRLSANKTTVVDDFGGTDVYGHQVAMNPTTLEGVDYSTYFSSGRCAMYIFGRWGVTTHRKNMGNFDWDVAPLPVYRSYKPDGTVDVEGLSSGHSGSMALAISKNSKQKNAAWMFLQYLSGPVGQAAQSKEGFAIPNQMELAMDNEIFLQTNQKPKNSIVFVEAAYNQRPADWTYLKDGDWITSWANKLNTSVRDGDMTVSEFFDAVTADTNTRLSYYSPN